MYRRHQSGQHASALVTIRGEGSSPRSLRTLQLGRVQKLRFLPQTRYARTITTRAGEDTALGADPIEAPAHGMDVVYPFPDCQRSNNRTVTFETHVATIFCAGRSCLSSRAR